MKVMLLLAGAMAAATPVAAAADRFVPRDPQFVVANISQTLPDEALRGLLARWRAAPDSEAEIAALARAFIDHARTRREPRYFGRAEALVATKARRPGAGADIRRLYAETLQFRHDFGAAEAILDALLREQPRDADARLRRGSLRLTRGDFVGARTDCMQVALAQSREAALATAGAACLAEALAGGGELARARLLLDAMARDSAALDPVARAYLLATRAELGERAGEIDAAIDAYARASALAPQDDSIRAALADALALRGDTGATAPLRVDNPSLALLVRQAAFARDGGATLRARARDWLALERARGDAIHYREAAMLALAEQRPDEALAAARRNFESQRELADVRVFARAATMARDAAALHELRQWLHDTGYQDSITAGILARGSGG
jgi:hypothetical protein